jgi:hypothetical protein
MLHAAPQDAGLVSGLVSKVVSLEAANTALKEQLQALQQQQQQSQHSSEPLHSQQQPGDCQAAGQQQQQQQRELQNAQQQVQHLQLEILRLRQQCKSAWQQVAEMKVFLNDYGLVWVGQPAPLQPETGQECCSTADGLDASPAYSSGMNALSSPSVKGSQLSTASPSAAAAAAGRCTAACGAQLPFDVSELQECLAELNQLAGDGIGQLKQLQLGSTSTQLTASPTSSSSSRGKALHLVTPDPVKLAIYKDGLVLHQCPPLPYSSTAADGILSDIFDGYFPSALRGEFPDGIPMQLVDRSGQTLAEATAAATAAAGQKGSNIIGWQDLEQQQLQGPSGLAALSGQAFLDRLPQTVIRNQQVVSVRPVVEQYINSSSSSSSAAGKIYIRPSSCSGGLARTASQTAAAAAAAAVAASQQSSSEGASAAPQQQQQQATIQVKSEDGKQTYVLMLPYKATIAALRASIDEHRASTGFTCHICQQQQQQQQQQALAGAPAPTDSSPTGGGRKGGVGGGSSKPHGSCSSVCCSYELRSAFPAKLYADGSVSLERAGLVPSATLFMRHAA